jgi:hypothetical protein
MRSKNMQKPLKNKNDYMPVHYTPYKTSQFVLHGVTFEVLTAVVGRNSVFRDVIQFGVLKFSGLIGGNLPPSSGPKKVLINTSMKLVMISIYQLNFNGRQCAATQQTRSVPHYSAPFNAPDVN